MTNHGSTIRIGMAHWRFQAQRPNQSRGSHCNALAGRSRFITTLPSSNAGSSARCRRKFELDWQKSMMGYAPGASDHCCWVSSLTCPAACACATLARGLTVASWLT